MKCLVAVKEVIDFSVKIRVKLDKTGVEKDHVKRSMNPFDEIALEEALRLKETGMVQEIIVVSIGSLSSQETLRVALARGGDRAFLVETKELLEPINIAKILQKITCDEKPELIILGKQAIDDDCNQTGQMLAGLLNWAQGTFISKINIFKEENSVEVIREVDDGLEVLKLSLPAVLTTDLRLNEPRYISLPNILKAKNKPLMILSLSDLKLDLKPHQACIQVEAPERARKQIKLETVKELLDKLQNIEKVI